MQPDEMSKFLLDAIHVFCRFLLPDVGANGGLCDLHLLTVTGGQERTHKEMDRLLGRAGFKESQLYKLSSLPSVLLAKKSECLDPSSWRPEMCEILSAMAVNRGK